MRVLLDPIMLAIKEDVWNKNRLDSEKNILELLDFLLKIDDLEGRLDLRNKLLKIFMTNSIWDYLFGSPLFTDYPQFKNNVLPYLHSRSEELKEPEMIENLGNIRNDNIPENFLKYYNFLRNSIIDKRIDYCFISCRNNLMSVFDKSKPYEVILGQDSNSIIDFLNFPVNDVDFIEFLFQNTYNQIEKQLWGISSLFSIRYKLVPIKDVIELSTIHFHEDFIRGLTKTIKIFEQPPEYRRELMRAIACIIYDPDGEKYHDCRSKTKIHRNRKDGKLLIAYIYQEGKQAPDNKCSRIDFFREKGRIYFRNSRYAH